jgi:hypothetical protein
MVDGDEREPARPGQRLRGRDADEQGADEAGALRDSDALDLSQLRAGLLQRAPDRREKQLEVMAGRDFRDDTSVLRVQLGLRRDDVGEEAPLVGDERRSRLVAGRLDAEDHAVARSRSGSFHMISASSRLSV